MSELSELIWRVSLAEEREGPWGLVLAGGQAVRLGQGFDPDEGCPNRYATGLDGSAVAGRDALVELLERHRDRRWH